MAWWRFVAAARDLVERADLLYSGYARPFDGQNQGSSTCAAPTAALPATSRLGRRCGALGRPCAACTTPGCRPPRSATARPATPTASPGPSTRRSRSCARRSSSPTALRPAAGARERQRRHLADVAGHGDLRLPGHRRGRRRLPGHPRGRRRAGAGADDRRLGRALRGHDGGRAGLPLSAAVPDGGGRARGGGRRRAAGGRSRRRAARLRRRRQPAHRLRGAQDDRRLRRHRSGRASSLAERGAANGDNAADAARLVARWARTRRTTLIAPYGVRNVIRGRLTEPPAPACATPASSCAAPSTGARARRSTRAARGRGATGGSRSSCRATRRRGRWCCATAATPTTRSPPRRTRSHSRSAPASGCRVSPRVATRGGTRTAQRPARGRPLPQGGKVVEMQARSPRRAWITFRTVRAVGGGRFATRYTFRPRRSGSYEMRARVRATDDYPSQPAFSRRRARPRALSRPATVPRP